MGLDIYLSYYKNYHQSKATEQAYEDIAEQLWVEVKEQEGDDLSQKTKDRVWAVLEKEAEKLGLDKYGRDITNCEKVEMDSKKYPEHYFNIGYFRSSYNGSGINSILKDLGIPDLYDIFPHEDQYEFCPDWSYSLDVVQEAIELLSKDAGYRVETVGANMFAPDDVVKNPAQALEIFNDKFSKKGSGNYNSFTCKDGSFYLDDKGLQVHALIPGKNMFANPCTFVVYKIEGGNSYQLEALEIVKETIEFVLSQKNPQAYYLRWSG